MFSFRQLANRSMSPPIRVLVAEDEMIISAKISMYLEEFGYEVAATLTRGEQVVELCRREPPDILLLDINLKGELDGIGAALEVQKTQSIPLIYLTANSDQATFVRARAARPFAFVTKPFQKAELERALAIVCDHLPTAKGNTDVSEVDRSDQILSDRIFLRDKDRMVKVMLDEILFVKAERAYCRVYTSAQRFTLSIALGHLEAQLPDAEFIRIHRSHLINVRHVSACSETQVQIGDYEVPLSRGYRERLLQRLNLIH